MCGLVGYFGQETLKTKKAFVDLLQIDVLRGSHSTGVAFCRKDNKVLILKDTCLPQALIYTKEFPTNLAKLNLALLGHNRAATKGAVNKKNAHPHHFGNIIGTHNGTLLGQHRLPKAHLFKSDSANLFAAIDEEGIKTTWEKVDGAATIVWWDLSDLTLHMLSNDQRPLWFTNIKDDSGVFWASESWMLRGVAGRHGIEIGTIYSPSEDRHYTFEYDDVKKKIDYKTEELTPFTFPIYDYFRQGHDQYSSWPRILGHTAHESKIPFTAQKEQENKGNVVPFRTKAEEIQDARAARKAAKALAKAEKALKKGFMRTWSGICLDEQAFYNRYPHCKFCEEALSFGDLDVRFYDDGVAACPTCHDLACEMSSNPGDLL